MALRRKTGAAPAAGGRSNGAGPRGRTRPGATGRAKSDTAEAKPKRLKQMWAVFTLTRQRDPKLLPLMLAALLGPLVVGILIGLLLGGIALWTLLGLLIGLLIALNTFSRRVQKTAYAEIEGKPGAAAGGVERMRGDWRLTAPVQVNRNQDLVSRVVSRAGVILIAEGRGRGPRDLLGAEVRRVKKVIGDAPLHDIIIGNGPGEVPLPKLQSTLMRKPRVLKKDQVNALDRKLKAIGGVAMPVPKGPMPRNIPRGGRMR